MREIKYRAFVKELNLVLPVLSISFDFKRVEVPAVNSKVAHTEWFHLEQVELMQYTGLKDKNDKEIYEGEIVRVSGHPFQGTYEMDRNYEVGYNEYMELCCGSWYLVRMRPWAEVIGNIHENKELLEN
ncbi:YopX family protein [Bacillus sp. BP-3]|uniref:YopX family protein n=1 Tax=Bacillus sp. BP-3 TaxID=3022773 RepID=UPI00232FB2F8|nr:YopX family protein [Bacillus sp. BP-3]MDC2867581.1 YopX family protein [Bacillus sp. BP-3]